MDVDGVTPLPSIKWWDFEKMQLRQEFAFLDPKKGKE
jgi:hypothetical protein